MSAAESTDDGAPARRRPELSATHRRQISAATVRMLRDAVCNMPVQFPGEHASAGDLAVAGAFVSLKRGRHLRSCCGALGTTASRGSAGMSLRQALEHAVERTIWEDVRFPAVSPSELRHLNLEVWVLFAPELVQARGEERVGAVEVGRHGLQVVRGQARGLLLPGVAVEHGWDATRFLDGVCQKAGLPPTAWRDDGTALFTFEGEMIDAALSETASPMPEPHAPVRRGELNDLVGRCWDNLSALLMGAVPRYFLGTGDGTVHGLALFLKRASTGELRTFSRISLRPGLALQSTLFSLVQSAAQHLASQGISSLAEDSFNLGLMILHEPMLHGSVADPHLEGFDPARRAVLVLERNKMSVVYDPAKGAADVLHEAAHQAKVTQPQSAVVFSLEALTDVGRACVTSVPTPVRGPAVRQPGVAGTFYPAAPAELAALIDRLVGTQGDPAPWSAALVPHAGLKYSGRLAADVLKSVRLPRSVIILGPKHTPHGVDWAVAPHETWALPHGSLASDYHLAWQLCDAIPGLELDAAAHQNEHAIEVELPLLARLAPQTKVVGIALGQGDLKSCRRFAAGLAKVMRQCQQRPLLVISSDMNHFASDAENRRLDALALTALESGDPANLLDTVARHNISMCGAVPAAIVLETLRLLDVPLRTQRVGYATSADVTGDKSRVVGYAGMLLG